MERAQMRYSPAQLTHVKCVRPCSVEAYYYRAAAYQANGEPARAEADMEQLKILKPDFKEGNKRLLQH
jgi:hypothetical protein